MSAEETNILLKLVSSPCNNITGNQLAYLFKNMPRKLSLREHGFTPNILRYNGLAQLLYSLGVEVIETPVEKIIKIVDEYLGIITTLEATHSRKPVYYVETPLDPYTECQWLPSLLPLSTSLADEIERAASSLGLLREGEGFLITIPNDLKSIVFSQTEDMEGCITRRDYGDAYSIISNPGIHVRRKTGKCKGEVEKELPAPGSIMHNDTGLQIDLGMCDQRILVKPRQNLSKPRTYAVTHLDTWVYRVSTDNIELFILEPDNKSIVVRALEDIDMEVSLNALRYTICWQHPFSIVCKQVEADTRILLSTPWLCLKTPICSICMSFAKPTRLEMGFPVIKLVLEKNTSVWISTSRNRNISGHDPLIKTLILSTLPVPVSFTLRRTSILSISSSKLIVYDMFFKYSGKKVMTSIIGYNPYDQILLAQIRTSFRILRVNKWYRGEYEELPPEYNIVKIPVSPHTLFLAELKGRRSLYL